MEKIYKIEYMYENKQQKYIDQNRPDLGIETTTCFTEMFELVPGKSPDKAIKNWHKMIAKRGSKKRVHIVGISEYSVNTVTSSEN